ncbi:GNAT family N-acetyltransferase [Peptoniphilus equinus]|uniref:GNAT family N-acetyltransferase n=1 Tax=Peptoniphilus equinus TaxID=3016343 RepID=A0ABY7QSX4_9FIRM|nr:GNAT family N-acetyltransferase [Peptoniphilus equinus]WBW49897.1 GNAT family N-acetyltransferase [Peptoniphilus equinus]
MTTMDTARLRLRKPEQEDFEVLYAIHADPRNNRYNPGWIRTTREDFQAFFDAVLAHHKQYGFGYYVLEDKEDSQVFGMSGLRFATVKDETCLNLYYRITPSKTRQGFVKEAARKIMDVVLDTTDHAYRVVVLTHEDNIPSRATAVSLGFTYHPELNDVGGQGNVYYFNDKG